MTAPRNALPKAVPEDEELGCGWLGLHIEKSSLASALDRARQHTNKIFPLAVRSTGAILPPVLKSFSSSWADRVESSTPSSGTDKTTFSSNEEQKTVPDSARYFIMRTTETFSKVSSFLIEKAISGNIGAVKTIRKMRSGDLFIEV
ncbi:hypothetical protein TNCV_19121 [Trichonephila clavipes]|nr:hypothetical protein TNCV_19121 [Trichonephila clavipes]